MLPNSRPVQRAARVLLLALVVAVPWAGAAPAGAKTLDLGFSAVDPAGDQLDRARSIGAGAIRIDVGWPAKTRPARATNPADPAYRFDSADAAARAAAARGMRTMLSVTGAPAWAEGRGRPRSAAPGSWKPDPAALGDYGAALARRYSGTFPDSQRPGENLPRATVFQPGTSQTCRATCCRSGAGFTGASSPPRPATTGACSTRSTRV